MMNTWRWFKPFLQAAAVTVLAVWCQRILARSHRMKVRPVFAWYDLWVGFYWDRAARALYAMVPLVGIAIEFNRRTPNE